MVLGSVLQELTNICILERYIHLRIVDVSNNQLSSLSPLDFLPNLLSLKADKNIIEEVDIKPHPFLQYISLSNNKIENISEGLSHPLVRHIDLSTNKIKELSQLNEETYSKLTVLKLQENAIETIKDINLPSLTSLSLGYNKMTDLQWISNLVNLEVFEINNNSIDKLDGFNKDMKKLKYIDLKENVIEEFCEIEKLACLPALTVLLLADNPITKEADFRVEVLSFLTTLFTLNYSEVTEEERNEANEVSKERQEAQNTQKEETPS
ncbi:leucine-rich repeat-containing protein 23 [Octopus bimaculoides]|uniref:leucine-rich repeat-containing protein 23 n=1 Tax=Octopus bimaculoides TaxID=37653 RepID=UPI00071DC0EF|nr:leucine-rich repeat-containing protein 23 [Octopus bimaculoides]|eukprot:XP_014769221.1 PREDICTED: leucine-rich repeat-containing protein 23-like [Octopus bimaculoides]